MNLRQLEYFLILAETEHMTQAAEKLNTSQPNISHAMSALEQELGVALFEKKGRNISLTRYGNIFYRYVSFGVQEIYTGQKMITEMINPNSGEILFGFIYTAGSYLAPSLIQSFLAPIENKDIHFVFHQGNSNQIIQLIKDDVIDVGLCSKISKDPDICYTAFSKEELIIVVPENHPLATNEKLLLKETKDFAYVYYNKQSGLRPFLDQVFAENQLVPKISCELEEDHSILGFVSKGYGIAIMPNIPSIAAYPVKKIAIKNPLPERNIYLAIKKTRVQTPVVEKFYDFCLKNGAKNLLVRE